MTDTQVTWLTQEAHDRLKAELDQLIAHRPIIAAEINDRREEGDLRENGGYHAARDEHDAAGRRGRERPPALGKARGRGPRARLELDGAAIAGLVGDVVRAADHEHLADVVAREPARDVTPRVGPEPARELPLDEAEPRQGALSRPCAPSTPAA